MHIVAVLEVLFLVSLFYALLCACIYVCLPCTKYASVILRAKIKKRAEAQIKLVR